MNKVTAFQLQLFYELRRQPEFGEENISFDQPGVSPEALIEIEPVKEAAHPLFGALTVFGAGQEDHLPSRPKESNGQVTAQKSGAAG
jgi:hypothetical protein